MLNYPQSQEAISIAEMAEGIIASSPIPKNEMLDRSSDPFTKVIIHFLMDNNSLMSLAIVRFQLHLDGLRSPNPQ